MLWYVSLTFFLTWFFAGGTHPLLWFSVLCLSDERLCPSISLMYASHFNSFSSKTILQNQICHYWSARWPQQFQGDVDRGLPFCLDQSCDDWLAKLCLPPFALSGEVIWGSSCSMISFGLPPPGAHCQMEQAQGSCRVSHSGIWGGLGKSLMPHVQLQLHPRSSLGPMTCSDTVTQTM